MEPKKMAITSVILGVVLVGLVIGVSVFTFQSPDTDLLESGLQVPSDWEFDMSDGTTLRISDLDGKIVLIDLMATWCTYCITQNTYLQTIYDTFAGPLEIVSLTIDRSETVAMMNDYKSDKGLTWAHGLDSSASFTNYFSVTSVPTLVLIDGDGYFRYLHVGVWTEAVLTDKIASIM
ncbi:TlpA family protein disulfide reductase [Candidatus Thorarchaeota archaeon]|nr:MAG: TlpA family protein disulfide reductase [Candidatus Thorarchaeota archaeon]